MFLSLPTTMIKDHGGGGFFCLDDSGEDHVNADLGDNLF
jgi:hypothetical protein